MISPAQLQGLQLYLFVGGDGARQVEAEAPAEPPGWGRVELCSSLHFVKLQHHVPGVQDTSAGTAPLAACREIVLVR